MTCNLPNTTNKAASDISTDPAAPAVSSFCVMFDNDDHAQEIVREIALKDLQIHPENPFIVETQNAPSMKELVESIRTNGIQTPLIVRPYGNGYQIISGHRRYFASIYAGRTSLPCIVREMDDNTARIVMCDANQQRKVTHIELALAIRLKIVALKNMGQEERIQYALEKLAEVDPDGDLLDNIKAEPKIYNILAAIYGVSPTTIKNISRLNELTPELLDRIRDNKVSPSAGRQLSFLTAAEQDAVAKSIDDGCHVSVSQAEKLHALSRNGNLDVDSIPAVMKKTRRSPLRSGRMRAITDWRKVKKTRKKTMD